MKKLFLIALSCVLISGCTKVTSEKTYFYKGASFEKSYSAAIDSVMKTGNQIVNTSKESGLITFLSPNNPLFQNNPLNGTFSIKSTEKGSTVTIRTILAGQMVDMSGGTYKLIEQLIAEFDKSIGESGELITQDGTIPQ